MALGRKNMQRDDTALAGASLIDDIRELASTRRVLIGKAPLSSWESNPSSPMMSQRRISPQREVVAGPGRAPAQMSPQVAPGPDAREQYSRHRNQERSPSPDLRPSRNDQYLRPSAFPPERSASPEVRQARRDQSDDPRQTSGRDTSTELIWSDRRHPEFPPDARRPVDRQRNRESCPNARFCSRV